MILSIFNWFKQGNLKWKEHYLQYLSLKYRVTMLFCIPNVVNLFDLYYQGDIFFKSVIFRFLLIFNGLFSMAKETEETSAIRFRFLSYEDYANAALFFTEACKDIKPIQGTIKLHTVVPHATNKIWVRDTSCFGDCCFKGSFQ